MAALDEMLHGVEHLMSKLLGYESVAEAYKRLNGDEDLEGRVTAMIATFQEHNPNLPQSRSIDEDTLKAIIQRASDVVNHPAVLLDGKWIYIQNDQEKRSEFDRSLAAAARAFEFLGQNHVEAQYGRAA
jgi:hypothetical protein